MRLKIYDPNNPAVKPATGNPDPALKLEGNQDYIDITAVDPTTGAHVAHLASIHATRGLAAIPSAEQALSQQGYSTGGLPFDSSGKIKQATSSNPWGYQLGLSPCEAQALHAVLDRTLTGDGSHLLDQVRSKLKRDGHEIPGRFEVKLGREGVVIDFADR